jgi:inner membrane protein
MDNITHSLIGAALAGATVPRDAPPKQRRVFFIAGIVAANLPDLDLLYTRITPPPLGYLIHHRGHTHTIVGLLVFAALIWLVTRLPQVREAIGTAGKRFWALVGLALASHLIADGWNSYGIHPFFPLSNQWIYGDAIFIMEPWFWVLLGVAVVLNTRNRWGRWSLAGSLILIPLAAAGIGMLPWAAVAALGVVATVLRMAWRPLDESRRATVALMAAVAFVALSASFSGAVARQIARNDPFAAARTVDLILNPRPGNPLCWDAMRLTREEAGTQLQISRGTVALPPGSGTCGGAPSFEWTTLIREPIAELRQLASESCVVRAWLQFGRAPALEDGFISDLRFGNSVRGNFSAMPVDGPAPQCPPNLTNWTPPRRDVLGEVEVASPDKS